jgi:hypothetical protein
VLTDAARVVELCAVAPGGARSRDATLRELGEIVAHRISPGRCVICDYTALPLESAVRPVAPNSPAVHQASLRSLIAAAADEISSRAPIDRLGRVRLDEVTVVLRHVESDAVEATEPDAIEVTLSAAPDQRPHGFRNAFLEQVASVRGRLASGPNDAQLRIMVPATLLNA